MSSPKSPKPTKSKSKKPKASSSKSRSTPSLSANDPSDTTYGATPTDLLSPATKNLHGIIASQKQTIHDLEFQLKNLRTEVEKEMTEFGRMQRVKEEMQEQQIFILNHRIEFLERTREDLTLNQRVEELTNELNQERAFREKEKAELEEVRQLLNEQSLSLMSRLTGTFRRTWAEQNHDYIENTLLTEYQELQKEHERTCEELKRTKSRLDALRVSFATLEKQSIEHQLGSETLQGALQQQTKDNVLLKREVLEHQLQNIASRTGGSNGSGGSKHNVSVKSLDPMHRPFVQSLLSPVKVTVGNQIGSPVSSLFTHSASVSRTHSVTSLANLNQAEQINNELLKRHRKHSESVGDLDHALNRVDSSQSFGPHSIFDSVRSNSSVHNRPRSAAPRLTARRQSLSEKQPFPNPRMPTGQLAWTSQRPISARRSP
eukprot:GILK01008589.1.p1 GENE.GILK01008589.1~~GILK01008589.1.p1  ORF type:complete len:431 (-),score=97.16 GILK01008589.1:115-1407(-)